MKRGLQVILLLCVLGFITSVYLTFNHYDTSGGSFCDVGESVSCSLVNTSVYSELFSVPVALFGALWFVLLFFMAFKALKNKKLYPLLLGWSSLGILFIIYMIIAEIILQAICPFCTIVHVIVLIIFFITLALPNSRKIPSKKIWKPWLIPTLIIFILPIIFFNIGGEEVNNERLVVCMKQNDVSMYGSFKCGFCAKQRSIIGDAFELMGEIECHPQGENPQTELCLEKNIENTPTWVKEKDGKEEKRFVGVMDIEELREFSGCPEEKAE